jgi:hypothetical protein
MRPAVFVPAVWNGAVPDRVYHATAAGFFPKFDLARSCGVIWFMPDRQEARDTALSFARFQRGPSPVVYECRLTLEKIARFNSEDDIYEFGSQHTPKRDRQDVLSAASAGLFAAGYDGLVDLYHNDGIRISLGALKIEAIEIVARDII